MTTHIFLIFFFVLVPLLTNFPLRCIPYLPIQRFLRNPKKFFFFSPPLSQVSDPTSRASPTFQLVRRLLRPLPSKSPSNTTTRKNIEPRDLENFVATFAPVLISPIPSQINPNQPTKKDFAIRNLQSRWISTLRDALASPVSTTSSLALVSSFAITALSHFAPRLFLANRPVPICHNFPLPKHVVDLP